MIAAANDTVFGLAAYVIGANVGNALAVAEQLEAGVLGVNRGFISDPAAPFGGVKQSGIGREGSQDGLHEFTEKNISQSIGNQALLHCNRVLTHQEPCNH